MNLLETSKKLSEEATIIEKITESLSLYIFSSKVRCIIFGYTFGKERKEAFLSLIQRLNDLSEKADNLLKCIEEYYSGLGHPNCLSQKKYRKLAKRFVYNAIKKNRLMKESINRIIKYLTSIEIAKEPKEHQVISHLIRNEFNLNLQYAKEINVLVSDIQGRVQIEENLVKEYRDLKRYLINKNEIDTGDILFRFKVKGCFKETLISRIISLVTSSQITHVLLAAKVSPSDIRMIDAHMERGSAGVHLRDFKILPGEILIVLRPRIDHFQIKLLLKKIVGAVKVKSGFSDLKLVGVFISYLISKIINKFKSGYALVPNFIRTRRSKYFCSELVNQAFREAGILLTPKSQYSNIVFPSDIITSPWLDYVGVICEDSVKSEAIINTCLCDAQI
jgi:hypothetical protein